jgi:NTE family protein
VQARGAGGDGARKVRHIRILEVLEERCYDIVGLAGGSMGALVGGLYAADTTKACADWVHALTHPNVQGLYDLPHAPRGIPAERDFARVSDILGDVRTEDLPLDSTAVATDLSTGEERWLRTGLSTLPSGLRSPPRLHDDRASRFGHFSPS